MKVRMIFSLLVLFGMVAGMAGAQNYTVNFTSKPPTIDGAVSAGEWDAAAPAITGFTQHDAAVAEDSTEPTKVRVLYGVTGLYVLYECTDKEVVSVVTGSERFNGAPEGTPGQQSSGNVGWTFAGTDYLAIYIDPANVADDRTDVDPSFYSYSLQAEPSITAKNEKDDKGNSYNYTEAGRYGGDVVRNTLFPTINDAVVMWFGGGCWELNKTQIKDGATANGYVMEFMIPWGDLYCPYYERYGGRLADNIVELNGMDDQLNTEPETVWGLERVEGGKVTGMPVPGTVWKVQFSRHSASAEPQYVNWVGSTGGFVSRPFGNLIFGEVKGGDTAVQNAALHQ